MAKQQDIASQVAAMSAPDYDPKPNFWAKLKTMLPGFGMSSHEALYTLLEGAVVIDGVTDPDESIALGALSGRSKELGKLPSNKFVILQGSVREKLRQARARGTSDALWNPIMEACLYVPKGWRASVYAHVVDIVLADRALAAAENKYLKAVAKALEVPASDALETIKQLKIKNEHIAGYEPPKPKSLAPQVRTETDIAFDELGVLSPEEAHYAILKCAVWADEAKLPPEGAELDALWRVKSLAACNDALRAQITDKIKKMGRSGGWEKLLALGCRHLPNALGLSAYGQAADLAMADRHLHHKEAKLLKNLETELKLPAADAVAMLKVIQIKSKH